MSTTSFTVTLSAYRRKTLVWLIVVVLLFSYVPSAVWAQPPTATLSSLSGTVLVNGQAQDQGTVLKTGDVLETQAGTTVVLEFSDGSLLEVGENTKVDLAELVQTATGARVSLIKLLWGRIRAKLSAGHQQAGSSFDIETPNALVGVKFSQPDVEVSYDLAKQETVALALTVALAVKNLITDEEKMIPIGSLAIITALGIKIAAGAATIGTIAAGTTSAGVTGAETTAGISMATKVALGAGALAAAGGVAAVAAGSGGSSDECPGDLSFTGSFRREYEYTNEEGLTRGVEIFNLTQDGASITGYLDSTSENHDVFSCYYTLTTSITGTVTGENAVLTVHPASGPGRCNGDDWMDNMTFLPGYTSPFSLRNCGSMLYNDESGATYNRL